MNFVVIRLGKDSISDINRIDSHRSRLEEPFLLTLAWKQVEESIVQSLKESNIYCFLYLGSGNNKGISTSWDKGIRALGKIQKIEGREDFQSTCVLEINVFSIFPKSYSSQIFLEESPELFKKFCNYPIIGLRSSRNNSIQKVNESSTQDSESLLTAIAGMNPHFRYDLSVHAPELIDLLAIESGDIEGYEKESTEVVDSLGWGDEYPLNTVLVRTEQRTVVDVVKRIEKGRYRLDPDFQRDFVWTIDKQSKLIESCLMRIPLPVFYVAEAKDGRIVVVDGLQRLTTFYRFLRNEFNLKGVGKKSADNLIAGKRFEDLPLKLQERIEDTQLTLYILDEKAPERAKLDIFDRVNGGEPLSRQQMRNCLFNGPGTKLLKEVSDSDNFLKVTGKSLDQKKMRDREVINRFCAFKLLGYRSYKGDMDDFLARALEAMNRMNEAELDKLAGSFYKSLRNNFQLFGPHSFRKSLASEDRYTSRSVINVSIFDVFSVLLSDVEASELDENRDILTATFSALVHDYRFDDAISFGTNSTKKVFSRFTLAEEKMGEVLDVN